MSMTEVFEDECVALEAIFGDRFTRLDRARIRMIVAPECDEGSGPVVPLFLECSLPNGYPDIAPVFDVSNTNNAWALPSVKAELLADLQQEALTLLGSPMLYNIVDWCSVNLQSYITKSLRAKAVKSTPAVEASEDLAAPAVSEAYRDITRDMNKKQKARFYERFGLIEEKPRGWDWVDVIGHLSHR